jgi:hypothetical protein
MKSTETLSYLEWNPPCSHICMYMMFFPLGYLQMESIEDMGHPGWNQDLTPRTAVIVAGTMVKNSQPAKRNGRCVERRNE